jgi:hypothetical protein
MVVNLFGILLAFLIRVLIYKKIQLQFLPERIFILWISTRETEESVQVCLYASALTVLRTDIEKDNGGKDKMSNFSHMNYNMTKLNLT